MAEFTNPLNFPIGLSKRRKDGGDGPREPKSIGRVLAKTVGGIVLFIFLFSVFLGGCRGIENPEAGKLGVVRNGGPLDDKQIKGILAPASGIHYTGLFSNTHYYPINQRNYTITSDPTRGDRLGADIFRTPTRDSVNVGVEGQVLFTINDSPAVIKQLDTRYGTRTNPIAATGSRAHPWEGDQGWAAFLDSWFRPTLENALRVEIAQFNCAELNAQCAMVKNTSGSLTIRADETNVNFVRIQDRLLRSLADDLDKTLGGPFFKIQKVNIVAITLPDQTQTAVDAANAEKAKVSSARYQAQQAKFKAQAALAQARANRANPYAGIEQVFKSLPENSQPVINVNLGGSGKSLNLGFNK